MITKTPVSISFDKEFLDRLDRTAKAWNMNRSACITWLCNMQMNSLECMGFVPEEGENDGRSKADV